jgi:hypothetical protein
MTYFKNTMQVVLAITISTTDTHGRMHARRRCGAKFRELQLLALMARSDAALTLHVAAGDD